MKSTHLAGRSLTSGLMVVLVAGAAAAAELTPRTVRAWDQYVEATEARIASELESNQRFLVEDFHGDAEAARRRLRNGEVLVAAMTTEVEGDELDVPGGMVHHWRGAVFLPGVSLDALLARLQDPSPAGPHQEDVVALEVLERGDDRLRLFIKMTKQKIVTVSYNTEHDVQYQRHGSTRASSRSVATKIAELQDGNTPWEREKLQGQDRGFLWRLNSYWRYEQVPDGVIVECESLTLSRTILWGVRTLIQPIVNRVARQSMARTLTHLRGAQTTLAAGGE